MSQLLLTNNGVAVARVPTPFLGPVEVLVKTHYSMVSMGTELAGLKPDTADTPDPAHEVMLGKSKILLRKFRKAYKNPDLAVKHIKKFIKNKTSNNEVVKSSTVSGIIWCKDNATSFEWKGKELSYTSDDSDWQYQAHTENFEVPQGANVCVNIVGDIKDARISIGILNSNGTRWLGNSAVFPGSVDDQLIFNTQGCSDVMVVISNSQGGVATVDFSTFEIVILEPSENGQRLKETEEIGWHMGYSLSGIVVDVGTNVTDLSVGDAVACAGAGKANHASVVAVPRNLVCRLPDGCCLRDASTATIGAIALQGIRRANPSLGERVCVIGLGLLGQLTAQMLQANGCHVIGLDLDERKVARAIENGMDLGSHEQSDFMKKLTDFTDGLGVDKTLITAATRSSQVVNDAMEYTRKKGCVVLVGDVGLNIERPNFYRKEIDLLMSTSYGAGRYDREYEEEGQDYPHAYVRWTINRNMLSYLELVAKNRVNVEVLIDRVESVNAAPELYKDLVNSEQRPLGVLLSYENELQDNDSTILLKGARRPQTGKINYVLVGAGAYGQSMIIPTLDKFADEFFLKGVVSADAVRGGNFVRERRLEVFSTDFHDVLTRDDIDLVVIATRHNKHANQVNNALQAGKKIFVEKPLALTWQELDEICETYDALDYEPFLMVGFNRRFAPAVQMLKNAISQRSSPLMLNYRLNGGFIPKDSWIQGKEGGGRNIGEACHIYDLFRFLVGARATHLQAKSIGTAGHVHGSNDNFCVTIGYEDGSLANLVYTALGPKAGIEKERLEVFSDGKAFILNDYKSLIEAGNETPLWSSKLPDKGQQKQFECLVQAMANGQEAPIPFEQILEASSIALSVEDLINQ